MILRHQIVMRKILTAALALILGLGIFANSGSALTVCTAACCIESSTSTTSHHSPKITTTSPCCCSGAAASPCEVAGGSEQRFSPPAILRAHQHDHRDLTANRTEMAAAPANSPGTASAPAVQYCVSILKVPIYITILTFLC